MSNFEFQLLDKSYDRVKFDCGSPDVNSFLKTKARQNQSVGFNKTFVAIAEGDKTKRILGFHSLIMGEVTLESFPPNLVKKLPKHPVPVVRMGRLAVDNSAKGKGLGKLLLVDAMRRTVAAAENVGVYALLVDAKDESARNFYLKFGFIALINDPMALFLPISSFPKT